MHELLVSQLPVPLGKEAVLMALVNEGLEGILVEDVGSSGAH